MKPELVRALVDRWQRDAAARRARTPHDDVAAALDSCAAELQEAFARESDEPLTPEEWGASHGGLTAQAVTRMCRLGELEAYRDVRGRWKIPPHAERARRVAA